MRIIGKAKRPVLKEAKLSKMMYLFQIGSNLQCSMTYKILFDFCLKKRSCSPHLSNQA